MENFKRFLSYIRNRWFFWIKPDPKPSTINRTGIIFSDHPKENNGWVKGWVVNTPQRDIIIVCKHSNPSTVEPNNKVFVRDKFGRKISRTIIKVLKPEYKLDGNKIIIPYYGDNNYFLKGDIAICKVNEPFPDEIKGYDIATNEYILRKRAVTFNQFGEPSIAQIHYSKNLAWIFGRRRDKKRWLIAGDSGTPWFVWVDDEWKVLTHTTKGIVGEGPHYGHPLLYEELMKNIRSFHHQ